MGQLDRIVAGARGAMRRRRAQAVLRLGRGPTRHRDDFDHLVTWARANGGVEGFVEPTTTLNELTVVLVAADGRWTRRAPGGPKAARRLGNLLAIPMYDVRKVGYPQRMRDYDARRRILRERARRAAL